MKRKIMMGICLSLMILCTGCVQYESSDITESRENKPNVYINEIEKCYEPEEGDYYNNAIVKAVEECGFTSKHKGATASYFCTVKDGYIYSLYETALAPAGGQSVNGPMTMKTEEYILKVPVEGKSYEILFEADGINEQIAGFSVDKNLVFIMKEEGLYRMTFEGEDEALLMETAGEGWDESYVFSYEDGQITVKNGEDETIVYQGEY